MTSRLQDLHVKGSKAQGETQELTFLRNDLHGYGALDKHEYAIGLKRGSLSRDDCKYPICARVHESLVGPFEQDFWALIPHPIESFVKIVEELGKNIRKPYGMQKELSDVIQPVSVDGMFLYRILFFPSEIELLDCNGNLCVNGATVLSSVHPFLALASLSRHTCYPSIESDHLVHSALDSITDWEDFMKKKGFNRKWIEDGFEDVDREVPEDLVVDFEPEVEADESGRPPLEIWNYDPRYPALKEKRMKEAEGMGKNTNKENDM